MNTHNTRRATLAVLTAGIFAAFTSRGEANNPISVEVEATPYGGTTSGQLPSRSGGCAFAPTVGTTFGGLGLRARMRQHSSRVDPRRGAAITTQVAVEHQENEVIREGSDHQTNVPPSQVTAAGSVAVGYDWHYFGVHAGASLRGVYGEPSIPCDPYSATGTESTCLQRAEYPTSTNGVGVFPELTLRGGPSDGFHGELGVGAYTPAMLLRPGVHAGVGYTSASGHDVTGRCGIQNTVGSQGALRCDLSGAVPLNEHVSFGLGAAVVNSNTRVDFDGRATVTVRIGP